MGIQARGPATLGIPDLLAPQTPTVCSSSDGRGTSCICLVMPCAAPTQGAHSSRPALGLSGKPCLFRVVQAKESVFSLSLAGHMHQACKSKALYLHSKE